MSTTNSITDTKPSAALTMSGMAMADLRHAWRVSLAVAFGVATATAVITGALLVGDSMRGSLRGLTVERLGKIDTALLPGGFFPFADLVEAQPAAEPLMFFPSALIEFRAAGDGDQIRRAGSVQVIGCATSFWDLDVAGVRPDAITDENSVVLNASTAAELGVVVGDQVTVRLPVASAVPADSPLGPSNAESEGLPRMEVVAIVPDRGLGRFSLAPTQTSAHNVFVDRATIADLLERPEQANAILYPLGSTPDSSSLRLNELGLNLQRVRQEFESTSGAADIVFEYDSLTSDRLLLPEPAVDAIVAAFPAGDVVPVMTYLANAIERLDEQGNVVASVPYSMITATEPTDSLPLNFEFKDAEPSPAGAIADDGRPATADSRRVPFVINSWLAERLDADVGTPLRVAYYQPEVESGREVEQTFEALVTEVVPLTEPATAYRGRRAATFDQRPTVYNDPNLTPEVPGVTDQTTINAWELPFELDRETDSDDDDYWNNYRLTPKAFLPLADGRRLFGSRFGQTTGLRFTNATAGSLDELTARIEGALTRIRGEMGWIPQPIRQQQLAASRGTTPFDALFLSLSFFVILAAVMLIAMLFRLGLLERLREFGTLLAVGWTPRRIAGLALSEGLVVATVGVLLGLIGGYLYARVILWGLRTTWVGAVTVPFLRFDWTWTSLLIGAAAGWLVSALAIGWTIRSLLRLKAQSLLSGHDTDQAAPSTPRDLSARNAWQRIFRAGRWVQYLAIGCGLVALFIAGVGASFGGMAAAGGFVGAGMLLLVATLLITYGRLRRPRQIELDSEASVSRFSTWALSARNASRNPLRSTLSIGLMSTAAFLVIAMTAFQLRPTESGTGGFELIATPAQPVSRDLGDARVRADLFGDQAPQLDAVAFAAFRLRPGQDASCNNLYQASQPTVLGVPADFGTLIANDPQRRPGFDWAATAAHSPDESPWTLLDRPATGSVDDPVPVVIDQNTAMWSLQMRGGIGERKAFEYEPGKPIVLEVVGLLSNSVLQGKLLISGNNFVRLFPAINGYGEYLIDCGEQDSAAISLVLESGRNELGMDVVESREVLANLLAVQNTYLKTFQSLGALGLLLGTIGLAIAQLRSVLERQRELAVLRALGFTRRRLAAIVLGETVALLIAGIGFGAVCAFLAVLPYAIVSGRSVPVVQPLLVMFVILLFGMVAGLVAVSRVLQMPLLGSLRAD